MSVQTLISPTPVHFRSKAGIKLTSVQFFGTRRCLGYTTDEPAATAQAPSFDRLSAGIQGSQEWHAFGFESLNSQEH
jgi:hypothetical protein